MNNRTLLIFLLFLGCAFKSFVAQAQNCQIIPMTMTTMTAPQMGSYNLWDVSHTTPEHGLADIAFTAVHPDDRGWIATGTYSPSDADQMHLYVARFDDRGRESWRKLTPVSGLQGVKRVIKHGAGYVVLGTAKPTSKIPSHVWIGFVNKAGALIGSKTIEAKKGDLFADDIISLNDSKTLIMSSHVKLPNGQQYTQMYKLSAKGTPLMSRYYRFGSNNQIESLAAAHNGAIMAVGNSANTSGRANGWALRLDSDLKIAWQKTYPRGLGGSLGAALVVDGDSWIAGGSVMPSNGGTVGAWVVRLDANGGDIGWERYFRGDRDYGVADMVTGSNGLISVALSGQGAEAIPDEPSSYDFTRLLTLNPRGSVTGSIDYLGGHGVYTNKLITGANGERLLAGSTYDKDGSSRGWIIATPGTGVYNDPCR